MRAKPEGGDQHSDQGTAQASELVEALRDEIAHLRREYERKDTIIMALSQSNAELSRTIRAIEAPETPESPIPTPTPPRPAVLPSREHRAPSGNPEGRRTLTVEG